MRAHYTLPTLVVGCRIGVSSFNFFLDQTYRYLKSEDERWKYGSWNVCLLQDQSLCPVI